MILRTESPRTSRLFSWALVACLALLQPAAGLHATTVVAPTFSDLVDQSDCVVRAVVKSVNSEMRYSGTRRYIVTKVELDVRETISGMPPRWLVLQMLGGKVGQEEMVVEGAPVFKVGEEDVLFIRGNGRRMNPLVALMHGRYPIRRDAGGREYMTRNDGAPLRSEQDVSRPMAPSVADAGHGGAAPQILRSTAPALSPADFAARIKARVQLGKTRAPREN